MDKDQYSSSMMKKLLQKSAENTELLISRKNGKTIYASNRHWIVLLGEDAMPILYRQAFAESVPVGKQGKWWIEYDDDGEKVGEEFEISENQSVFDLWEQVKAIGGAPGKITPDLFNAFGGSEIYRRIQHGKQSVWVDEEYLTNLYDVAKMTIAQPEIKVPQLEDPPRVSIWAGEAIVAVLMPVKDLLVGNM